MPERRLFELSDLPDLMRLKEAAGWNQTGQDWRNVLAIQPDGCFAIEHDGRVAATATVVCYGRELAWIGMVLTAPEFRGRGFARRLMETAIGFAGARGVACIKLDATDMGLPLYASLGFQAEGLVERWLRPGTGSPESRAPEVAAAPDAADGLPLALDREAFGVDRTQVVKKLAVERYRAADGYALARPGSNATYFGPCVAASAGVALELLQRFGACHPGESVYWDLLDANREAMRLAGEAGFEVRRKLTRMRLQATGARPLQNDDSRVFGIAGFEYG